MSGTKLSVGIIGLPNVGKSTLFKALTKNPVDISNYPFTTIDPNVGIVEVPDERLASLAELIKPEKTIPTIIEFVDIAGLVKDAHKGEGLGNQFLARIREVDMVLHVVRAFEDAQVAHVETTVDPKRDFEIIKTELAMKDLETIEKHMEKLSKEIKAGDKKAAQEKEMLIEIKKQLNEGKPPTTTNEVPHLQLLTAKKGITIINSRDKTPPTIPDPHITIDIKLEEELAELTAEEIQELGEKSHLSELITACYKTLNLITFFTIKGGKELRAWTLKNGENAEEAAYRVHTDFGEKFIRAEVISYENLTKAGSWHRARETGVLQTEGKEYVVKDGDILEFKI